MYFPKASITKSVTNMVETLVHIIASFAQNGIFLYASLNTGIILFLLCPLVVYYKDAICLEFLEFFL